MIKSSSFSELNLSEPILKAIEARGFTTPSPIQTAVIPSILGGLDVVGQAQTGTGKTAAYGLPALSLVHEADASMLVITPTRELALQVSQELQTFGKEARIKTATIYGGSSFTKQLDDIRRGAQVVVGTPGRLLDLLSSGRMKEFKPSIVVLDEADEMLNMGFLEDVQSIFEYLPKDRQTLLFSATMSPQIQKLIKNLLHDPQFIKVTPGETTNQDIEQQFYVIQEHEREQAVVRLLDTACPEKAVIFCRTRRDADGLSDLLAKRGQPARALHGELEQKKREEVVSQFRRGSIKLLIATDVAARGLNVPDISHVVNFHMPYDAESYVHRIGRTARAGKSGTAMSLVTPREMRELDRIRVKMGTKMKQHQVPTKTEAMQANANKMIQVVKGQTSLSGAKEVLSSLTKEMGIQELAERLLSSLMTKHEVSGPEQIGLPLGALDRFNKPQSSHYSNRSSHGRDGREGRGGPRRFARSPRKKQHSR